MTSIANEAAFYRYMEKNGPVSDGGKRNYLSWLRYVNDQYSVDFDNLDNEDVHGIFRKLSETSDTRQKYTSGSAIADIKSALNKYLAFVSQEEPISHEASDVASIIGHVSTTTKNQVVTRLGQGKYRQGVIAIWRKCAVTMLERVDLLIASHIKPWSEATNEERIDPNNGLLLSPNLDRLFDGGYVSFGDDGTIMISPLLDSRDLEHLAIDSSMKLYKVEPANLPYLKFHRENVYVK